MKGNNLKVQEIILFTYSGARKTMKEMAFPAINRTSSPKENVSENCNK